MTDGRQIAVCVYNAVPVQVQQFGALKKLETKPPSYTWDIDGQTVPLSPDEMLNYKLFRRAVFMASNRLLPLMKEAQWTEFVQRALPEMASVPMPEDASVDGQLWEHVKRFANGRSQAVDMEDILLGKPFRNDGFYYLRIADIVAYLHRAAVGFKAPSVPEIAASLRRRGGRHQPKKLRGQSINLWVFADRHLKPDDEEAANAPMSLPQSLQPTNQSPY